MLAGILGLLTGPVASQDIDAVIEAAIADERRPEADTSRDAGRKPAEIVRFFQVEPGDTVIDLHSGGGYYAKIFSGVVGDGGQVYAHYTSFFNEQMEQNANAMAEEYGNIELIMAEASEIDLPDNSVDMAFLGLIEHHWHYNAEEGETVPEATMANYENIFRMLKPGGVFAIIEHQAKDGVSRAESAQLHRVPADIPRRDIQRAGFEFYAESHALRNPADPMVIPFFELPERDSSNRIVQMYRKPLDAGQSEE